MSMRLINKKHVKMFAKEASLVAGDSVTLDAFLVVGSILLAAALLLFGCREAMATETGVASFYSSECCQFNPDPICPTASGESLYELETFGVDFAAAWDYQLGAQLRVTNVANGRSVTVEVLDRGPAKRLNRLIDLSKSAFKKIADLREGLITVEIEKT